MISFNFQKLRDDITEHLRDNNISSRQKLSYQMDVEEATINRVFCGAIKKSVELITLYKMCKVLGTKMNDYIIDKS